MEMLLKKVIIKSGINSVTDEFVGRLLIMTSNNPDALDAALTRPGRIDKKIRFGNMSKASGKSIFRRLVGRSALTHDAAYTMDQIDQFAVEFAEKIPNNVFTPAQVQNFLQDCRGDPEKALAGIEAWVEMNRPGVGKSGPNRSTDTLASLVEQPVEGDAVQITLDDDKFNLVRRPEGLETP